MFLAGTARADDMAAATTLFDQGMALMTSKDYPRACAKLREAVGTAPGLLGAMLWLGDCYEKNGQYASAWAQFRQAASVAADKHDPREKVARRRATEVEAKLSYLMIAVPEAIDGLEIRRDGEVVGPGAWGSALPVDAGEHDIVATAPGRRAQRIKLTVAVGDKAELSLPAFTIEPPKQPQQQQEPMPPVVLAPERNNQRLIGFGVAALGVVGIGVGAFFGLRARSQLDDSNADGHCRQPGDQCDEAGRGLRSDASTSATISTIAVIAGAISLAGGVVLVLTAPPRLRVATLGRVSAGSDAGTLALTF